MTVRKDGRALQADDADGRVSVSHVDGQVRVEVCETTPDDAGEYTVTAVNDYGRLEHAVTVVVLPATGLE